MKTFLRRSPFPALLVFLFSVRALAQAPASAADEKDIRSIGTQIQDAWNKADTKMLADLWLTDGDYVSSTGRTARGRAEVKKAFAEQWAGIYKGTKIAHTFTSVGFVRRDVAIADGAFEISGMKDAAGKLLPSRSGLSTIVAVKKGDRWYVAALRGMVPSVPSGAPGK
jgi:uncharacterized protein (TIGR02246 family)